MCARVGEIVCVGARVCVCVCVCNNGNGWVRVRVRVRVRTAESECARITVENTCVCDSVCACVSHEHARDSV